MYPRAMIFLAVVGVSLSLVLGLFWIITWEVASILIAVFIGIPTLIIQMKAKPKEEETKK
jgi:asparagine N-glycosylation enzyme membrane subunit Stt3